MTGKEVEDKIEMEERSREHAEMGSTHSKNYTGWSARRLMLAFYVNEDEKHYNLLEVII